MSRQTTVLLVTGDYADRLNALYAEAQAAERAASASSRRLNDSSLYDDLKAQYDALKAEAEAQAIKVTLKAIGRREWRVLKEKHPPRAEGDPETLKGDRLAGVNADTVEDDLVYASLVEPAFTTRAQYDEWVDALSEGEFQTILSRAWSLVNVAATDPKSLPALLTRSGDANDR